MYLFSSRKSISDAIAIIHDYQVKTNPDNVDSFPINGDNVGEDFSQGPYLTRINLKLKQKEGEHNEGFEP